MSDRVYIVLRHLYNGLETEAFVFVDKKSADKWVINNQKHWASCSPWYQHVGYRKPKGSKA